MNVILLEQCTLMQFTKYFVNEGKHTDPLPYKNKHELLF